MRNSTFLKTLLLGVAVLLVYSVPALAQVKELDTVWVKTVGGSYDPHSIEFSPDGQIIAVSVNGAIKLLRSDNGNVVREFPDSLNSNLSFSPDGRLLAAGGQDFRLRIFDIEKGLIRIIKINDSPDNGNVGLGVSSVEFLPDGKHVLIVDELSNTQIRNIETGEIIKTYDNVKSNQSDFPIKAMMTRDGKYVAIISYSGAVTLRDAVTGDFIDVITGTEGALGSFDFSHDSKMMALAGGSKKIYVLETGTWKIIKTLIGHTTMAWSPKFSSDDRYLVSAGDDGTRFWNLETGVNTYTSSLKPYIISLDDQMKYFAAARTKNLFNNRAHYNITGIEDTQPKEPTQLSKITPNPATSECSIRYSVTEPTAHVRLELIGVEGTLIAVLESGQKAEGNYTTLLKTTDISGASLSGGAYFIRLIIDGKAIATQQFSVVR